MKFLPLVLIFVFAQTPVFPQKKIPEWLRVYTFDDQSSVELNNKYVTFSTDNTARVRFRWIYAKPLKLDDKSDKKYKTVIQEIVCDCAGARYKNYEMQWFDADEKLIQTTKPENPDEWKNADRAGTIRKIFKTACELIKKGKSEPLDEH